MLLCVVVCCCVLWCVVVCVCVFVGVCVCVCALLWLAMSHVLVTPFLEDRTAALQTAGPAGTETDRAVSSQRRLKFLNAAPFVYY